MNKPYLSVIIPAFNESENFKNGKIHEMYDYLKKQNYSFEIVFVDDGSTDDTANKLKDFSKNKPEVKIILENHKGKGPAVSSGMINSVGENRLFTDFDQATPIQEVEKLLPFRNRGYDIIIGSREVQGAKREKEPFHRHLMGKGFNIIVKILVVRGINDTQCGFKLLSEKATKHIFPKLTVSKQIAQRKDAFTGAFDVEMIFLGRKSGYKIAEVPVYWQHFKTNRVSPIKDSMRMLFEVIKIRLNSIFGKYK
ncbi:dolichyl-phosphate beta-glucosyltransferase [Patescibacteria group bacterium]